MNILRREIGGWGIAAALSAMVIAAAGCDSDLFTVDVNLQKQVYSADFGEAQGTIPTVTCDPAGTDVCGAAIGSTEITSGSASAEVHTGCDAVAMSCFAQARVLGSTSVNVLQDDNFITKVERRGVAIVRDGDVVITVPVNTLTFSVPAIQIFVGPPGATRETDDGVVSVGVTEPLTPGQTVTDSDARHLVVQDGSPAHTFISASVQQKQTMVFLMVMTPQINAGAPLPAGAIEVDMSPKLKLGF
jgi:hypothetical protein